jgi:hypothetical protein
MKVESTVGVGTELEIVVYLRQEPGEEQNLEKGKAPEPS